MRILVILIAGLLSGTAVAQQQIDAGKAVYALDQAIRAVAPIDGISMGRADDWKTWRIDFQPQATPAQIAAANAILLHFDPVAASRP